MGPPSTTFAEATAVMSLTSHTYSAHFREDWCIGSVPHGGYVTATFLQVAKTHFAGTLSSQNQPHSIALHLDFLRRTQEGPAFFTVQDTKLGRQASVIHITLSQGSGSDERQEVVGYITNINMHTEEGISPLTSYMPEPAPLPVNLSLLAEDRDENWALQPSMPFSVFRKATMKTQFHFPRIGQTNKNSSDEWIRMTTGEKWTNATLGYVSDMWPMPAEALSHKENPYDVKNKGASSKTASFWYPTLLLNLDIKKALPEEGVEWLFVRVAVKEIKKGRMDISVEILDEGGELVALSHHVSFILPAARNLASRRTGSDSKI